jgi:very-short-patch-repair endonuclease
MRRAHTSSEAALWRCISGRQLGVAFKRQQVIGKYIVDFVAPSVKLIVEVDGGYHASRHVADARRDRYLERAGYRVIRVPAEMVLRQLPVAVAVVRSAVGETEGKHV